MISSQEATSRYEEQREREIEAIRAKILAEREEDAIENAKVVMRAMPKMRQDVGILFRNLGHIYEAAPHIGLKIALGGNRFTISNKGDEQGSFFVDFLDNDMVVKEGTKGRELVLAAGNRRMPTSEPKERLDIVIPMGADNALKLDEAVVKYQGTRRELKGGSVFDYVRFTERQSQPLAEWLVDNFDSCFHDAFEVAQSAYASTDPFFRTGYGGYQSMIDADPKASKFQKDSFAEMGKIQGIFRDKVAGDFGIRGYNVMFMEMALHHVMAGKRLKYAPPSPADNM